MTSYGEGFFFFFLLYPLQAQCNCSSLALSLSVRHRVYLTVLQVPQILLISINQYQHATVESGLAWQRPLKLKMNPIKGGPTGSPYCLVQTPSFSRYTYRQCCPNTEGGCKTVFDLGSKSEYDSTVKHLTRHERLRIPSSVTINRKLELVNFITCVIF
jgi:hypothetical protein